MRLLFHQVSAVLLLHGQTTTCPLQSTRQYSDQSAACGWPAWGFLCHSSPSPRSPPLHNSWGTHEILQRTQPLSAPFRNQGTLLFEWCPACWDLSGYSGGPSTVLKRVMGSQTDWAPVR